MNRVQLIRLQRHIRQHQSLRNIPNEYDRLRGEISRYPEPLRPAVLTDRVEKLQEITKLMGLKLDNKDSIK